MWEQKRNGDPPPFFLLLCSPSFLGFYSWVELRGGMVLPEESDPRLQGSWVPGTPAKPVSKRLAAAASGQESNSTVLSWFRSATASSDGHAGLRGFEERAVGLSGGEAAVVAMESCSPSCSNNVAMRAQPMGEPFRNGVRSGTPTAWCLRIRPPLRAVWWPLFPCSSMEAPCMEKGHLAVSYR